MKLSWSWNTYHLTDCLMSTRVGGLEQGPDGWVCLSKQVQTNRSRSVERNRTSQSLLSSFQDFWASLASFHWLYAHMWLKYIKDSPRKHLPVQFHLKGNPFVHTETTAWHKMTHSKSGKMEICLNISTQKSSQSTTHTSSLSPFSLTFFKRTGNSHLWNILLFFNVWLKFTDRYSILGCDLCSKVIRWKEKCMHTKQYHILYVHWLGAV